MGIKQRSKSLLSRQDSLSDTFFQLRVLNESTDAQFPLFSEKLAAQYPLLPSKIEIFQINVGKRCNQSCAHCHVDAGPDRREEMSDAVLERCLDILAQYPIPTVDITGGAPEMHPQFRRLVQQCRALGKKVMNRCNLTIIVSNPAYNDLPQFFAENQVHIVSSLPYFSASRTDSQRGEGVFEDSIKALKMLNEVGYGKEGTGLLLDLVYNPSGAFLPAGQKTLEDEFKRQLRRKFGIEFNNLYAITNMPISRYLEYLLQSGNYRDYMQLLVDNFNPDTVSGLMCRNTLSVSWDGYIYDCDFNQMLDLKVEGNCQHIDDFDLNSLQQRTIAVRQHCYGCTAGAGSSCGGELV